MYKFRTILIDPPWEIALSRARARKKGKHCKVHLPYPTLSDDRLSEIPVADLAHDDCHLWLWTTNQTIERGLQLIRRWGFHFLAPVHWIKPSGMGNYFAHRTQTLLFAYYRRCRFERRRYMGNVIEAPTPTVHSRKPKESYAYIESISLPRRLELFAREHRRGWSVWGNEVHSDVSIPQVTADPAP